MSYLRTISPLSTLFEGADFVEERSIEGNGTLRQFTAGMMYLPGWLVFLYRLRAVFVRILGMKQEEYDVVQMQPEDVSFDPGAPCQAFTVTHGKEGEHLALQHEDTHLSARLLLVAVPLPDGRNRFHVGTIVHHKHWTGPVYFNVIKPFHHLVVWRMMKNGVKT